MKYQRGKGRKPRKQVRVFCLKQGGGKFSFRGGSKHPIAGGSALAVKSIIRSPDKDHTKKKT